ncbi:hypothetical protein [Pseudochryseolinea flava]|uniref:Lipoprotein n=1 Tax=Pseudochryseolinea flava TaxID=2059302 RepID=A0A364XUU8_9BACT|nr:hypothetical protein [Pseudochryseolinea flava]RAV98094.1 hypothetical protein DQQ10_25510 [Pseudochryseolinea flava]
MKINRLIHFSLCLAAGFSLVSCGSSSDKQKNSDEFSAAEDSLKQQIEEVVYNIPSPSEIPYLLQTTGAEFNEGLLSSREKVDQYASRHDKAALNLGIYASDIGYLTSYDKTQEAIDYLNASKTLADNLGVTGTFDAQLLKKFEENISNKDSLTRVLDNTIKQTSNFLKDNKSNKLSALIITGSFVEGLYISTGVVKSYPKNLLPDDKRNQVLTPLMRIILQQKKSVSELLKMLKTVEQTEPVVAIVNDLVLLETAYGKLNIEEQIAKNRGDLVLTDKNLEEITTITERIRKGITS